MAPRVIRGCDPSIEWAGGRFIARLKVGRWHATDPDFMRKTRDKSRPFDSYLQAIRWLTPYGCEPPALINCWRRQDWEGRFFTVCLGREGRAIRLRVISDQGQPYDGVYATALPGHDLQLSLRVAHPSIMQEVNEVYDRAPSLIYRIRKEEACLELLGLETA